MGLLILNGSSRENGNAEDLAKIAAASYKGDVEWVHLREHTIQQIHDQRHAEGGFTPVDDDHRIIVEKMLAADDLLFVTPIYWYTMSGHLKTFIDRWSQSLRDPELRFKEQLKGKRAYLLACGGDEARIKGLPLIQQFTYTCQFVGLDFTRYFIGKGSKPGDALANHRNSDELVHFFHA